MTIEVQEVAIAAALLDSSQTIAQIVFIVVQKALFLDKVDKHQAVEHQRCIPFAISFNGDTLNEPQECGMFGLEAIIETSRDTFNIKGSTHASSDVAGGELLFLI